jgi:hypothetical protein
MVVNVVLGAIAEQTPALYAEAADDLGSIRLDSADRTAANLRLYRRIPALSQAYARPTKTTLAANSPVSAAGNPAQVAICVIASTISSRPRPALSLDSR